MATTDRRTVVTAPQVTPSSSPSADPFYNVARYGAVGDGATDSTVAIQNAVNDARSGGIVYFPGGTYITTGINLFGRVILQGAGSGATVLLMKANTSGDIIKTDNFSGLTSGTSGNWAANTPQGPFSFGIRDMDIDGNSLNGGKGYGIRIYGFDYFIENVRVRYCSEDGIYSEWAITRVPTLNPRFSGEDNDSYEAHLVNVKVHNCGNNGIEWHGPTDSTWVNVVAWRNGQSAGASGFFVGINANGLQAYACQAWGNSHAFGWFVQSPISCTDCVSNGANTTQVVIDTQDFQWRGGFIVAGGGAPLGFQLGRPGHNPIFGAKINTTVEGCTSGAIAFEVDGGSNDIDLTIYQESGIARAGAISQYTNYRGIVFGTSTPNQLSDTFIDTGGWFLRTDRGATIENNVVLSDGILQVAAGRIFFGGGSAVLKSVPTELQVRDSNDGSYAPMEASEFIVNNNGGATAFFQADRINFTDAVNNQAGAMLKSVTTEIQSRFPADNAYASLAGNVRNTSSAKFKNGIEPWNEPALIYIKTANVHSYERNAEPGVKTIGLILEHMPDVVKSPNGDCYDVGAVIGILWKGIQELSDKVDSLTQDLGVLRSNTCSESDSNTPAEP